MLARHLIVLALCAVAGCEGNQPRMDRVPVPGGRPTAGLTTIEEVGCGACHAIPGVDDARGVVGPPLTEFGQRTYIAGAMPNAPRNLVAWIMDPPSIEPRTAMPDLGLDEKQARDIAAYLYTLR